MKLAESDKVWIKSVEWLRLIGKMTNEMTISKSDSRDIELFEQDGVKFYIFHYIVNGTPKASTALIPADFINGLVTPDDVLTENEKYDRVLEDIWKVAFNKEAPTKIKLPQVEKIRQTARRKEKNARKKKRKNKR